LLKGESAEGNNSYRNIPFQNLTGAR